MKYRIRIPEGWYNVHADDKITALNRAKQLFDMEFERAMANGELAKIPYVISKWTKRNSIKELEMEQPIKPSRLKRNGRMR